MLVCLPSALEEDEVIMSKPEISSRFDVEDIRKILEYNSLRHIRMTPEEIITETQFIQKQRSAKKRKIHRYTEDILSDQI